MKYHFAIFDLRVKKIPPPNPTLLAMERILTTRKIKILDATLREFKSPVVGTHAYTWTFILSGSHATIHTAPEDDWIELIIGLCNGEGKPEDLKDDIEDFFDPILMTCKTFTGQVPERRR
jgi:S-adenosylmethionine/arginine decarboxylase-like enzyme